MDDLHTKLEKIIEALWELGVDTHGLHIKVSPKNKEILDKDAWVKGLFESNYGNVYYEQWDVSKN